MNSKRKASPCCVDSNGGRVVSLDDDVLTEILARLPVKSLTRFQLVCKSWLSLISTDHFRRLRHLRCLHKPHPSLILAKRSTQMIALFNFNPVTSQRHRMIPFSIVNNSKILSCSNGLMLLKCDHDYYVHNPTTNQSRKLSLPQNDRFIHIVSLHLIFDPSKSLHYKIVCIRAEHQPCLGHQTEVFNSGHQIEVLESESGKWRVCVEPFTSGEIMNFSACVQCKSLVYLIYSHTHFGCVYCFNVVKKVSEIIVCLVPRLARSAYSHSLQESDGCLYYCALLREGSQKSAAAVWELRVNVADPRSSKWLLKHRHVVHRLPDELEIDLLTFVAEMSTVFIRVPGKIVAYNFHDMSYKELFDLEPQMSSLNVHQFGHQTLAPI